MTNFDLKTALEQQQNVVEELSKMIVEKCWATTGITRLQLPPCNL